MKKSLISDIVQYIDFTNDLIEKNAQFRKEVATFKANLAAKDQVYKEKLAQALDSLSKKSLIPSSYKDDFYELYKDHPEKVAEFMSRIENNIPTITKTGSGTNKILSKTKSDPILDFCRDYI